MLWIYEKTLQIAIKKRLRFCLVDEMDLELARAQSGPDQAGLLLHVLFAVRFSH